MNPSYAAGDSGVPLLQETIGDNLAKTAAKYPESDAIVSCHQNLRYTYAQLNEEVDALAAALITLGLEKGDRLGIWSPNCAEWVLLQYATARAGIILVNINPAYRTAELEYALEQSGCSVLVAASATKTSDYPAMVAEVMPRLSHLRTVIHLDTSAWNDLLSSGRNSDIRIVRDREATLSHLDPINIQYTSGTTGFPKGATLSHYNILNNGYFVARYCAYTHNDRVCIPVPFYHCFGMVMGNLACTSHGACIVIPSATFDPGAALKAVETERCTSLYGVPTMFIAVLDHPSFDQFDISTLRTGIMAGSPCPIEVMKQVVARLNMRDVTICYGMTETSPVSTQTELGDPLELRVGTVGRVHPHVEIKIVDPATGETLPRGEKGEFCTRGYCVMGGYWNDPERTAEAIDVEGWMHTGDLATMNDDGYINIVGRAKDMIIRGGENVYPREIEEYLYTHPEVSDVQVVGVPDTKYGEIVVACIRPCEGAMLTEDVVKDYCRGRIAHYKVPARVFFTETMPLTVTGKVQKYRLREMSEERLHIANIQITA